MSHPFPKAARLRKRADFQRVAQIGTRKIGKRIIVEYRNVEAPQEVQLDPRMGITVSRHHGKAHERNRFKRIVREGFRHCQSDLPRGLEIIVKPRAHAKSASSKDILKELLDLLTNGRPAATES